jgi:hypothetical protein
VGFKGSGVFSEEEIDMVSQSTGKTSVSPSLARSALEQRCTTPDGAIGAADAAAPPTSDRASQIAVAAYYKSQLRRFAAGREIEDWLAAEQEVDAHEANRSGAPVEARY